MIRIPTLRSPLPIAAWLMVFATAADGGQLAVVSSSPAALAGNVPVTSTIAITFDQALMTSSVSAATFRVFGRASGPISGTITFENADHTLRLTPGAPLSAGQTVGVLLSNQLQAADGSFLRSAGYAYEFRTAAQPAIMKFTQLDVLDLTAPNVSPRPYGGVHCDLNDDGYSDLAIVNEDTSDIRVLLNTADGTGLYDDYLTPTNPVDTMPSPNDAGDFNGDGLVDICTTNVSAGSISIVLGNGDGTFQPRNDFTAGSGPHGMGVLDVDGDGDMDVATANTGANNVSLLLNNGSGGFGAPTNFEGGGSGEWAMSAADMNNDQIYDLVVGARFSQDVIIHLGNGNGTFTLHETQDAGGDVWMIVCGDVNGDGNMDVTTANNGASSGSILLGDGAGNLAAPLITPTASGTVATDLGDMDGDGDLDWVLSSFGGSQWRLFTNNGSGVFTFDQSFDAFANPACAVILDIDNDQDLDLGLIDEIYDTVTLMQNSSTPPPDADINNDGHVNAADLALLLGSWAPCAGCPTDLNGDGTVNASDLALLLGAWG